MSASKLQRFVSVLWVLWVSELEAVNLGTMRKDNLGSTWITVHTEQNCASLRHFFDHSRVANTSALNEFNNFNLQSMI